VLNFPIGHAAVGVPVEGLRNARRVLLRQAAPVLLEIRAGRRRYARVFDIRGRAIPALLKVRGPDAGPND
jgi:hypothetical protein